MNKTTAMLTLTLAAAGLGGAMPTFALDSLRGAAIEKMSASPAKRKIDVVEGGIERTFEQQPPLIPHKIESYKLNLRQHGCLKCHSKARAEQENTKPPSARFRRSRRQPARQTLFTALLLHPVPRGADKRQAAGREQLPGSQVIPKATYKAGEITGVQHGYNQSESGRTLGGLYQERSCKRTLWFRERGDTGCLAPDGGSQ